MSDCTVCGAEVDAVALRPTVPSDWEYRYSSMLVWTFEPGTQERHRCRLVPRMHIAAEESEVIYGPPRPGKTWGPPPEQHGTQSRGGVVL